jgi:hypothetical protein
MPERSGWRDERISIKHRDWVLAAPAFDLDFLLIECKYSSPVALIEYKEKGASPCRKTDPQYKALTELGNKASLPAFNVRYSLDGNSHLCRYKITPLNDDAEKRNAPSDWIDELEYMCFLHGLRGSEIPDDAITSWIADKAWD